METISSCLFCAFFVIPFNSGFPAREITRFMGFEEARILEEADYCRTKSACGASEE